MTVKRIELDKSKKTIAIVGSRAATNYGMSMAEYFAEVLSADYNIITKADVGISEAVIIGCKKANNPYWIVSATNTIYPYSAKERYENATGIYIAHDEDIVPKPSYFVDGSKLLSEVADVVLIVEAREQSGLLIIADIFKNAGKTVFCVPGRMTDPMSRGCNKLIKDGTAKMVTCAEDIIKFMEVE